MSVPELDRQIGIEVYSTKSVGIGGKIKHSVNDFVVEESLIDGSNATIAKTETNPVLGSTLDRQRYLLCVLVKRNWDTFIAIKNISISLVINQNRIQIAGIKDAKAVTAQFLTLDGVTFEEVEKIKLRDLELRPVGYFREQLSSFYLLGNRFRIKITGISNTKKAVVETSIKKSIEEISAAGGLPNFYGHQRFGTTRPITHLVGKSLVQGNLEEAGLIFLAKHSPFEHPESQQARMDLATTRDFKKALQDFPVQLRFERLMLAHLAEAPNDFLGAFRRLPIKLRLLFVQAWQSYLFNRFLSARIRKGFSLNKAEVGDFVVNVERSGLPMINTGKIVDSLNFGAVNSSIAAGKMRIAVPIFGAKQKLSSGVMGELETLILEEEGAKAQGFRVPTMPEIGAKGELRAIVCPVGNFALGEMISNEVDLEVPLDFMLLRGSYATVLLREIMKPQDLIGAGF